MKGKPRTAITVGDPNGIGPEIALKTALDPQVRKKTRLFLVGCPDLLQEAARHLRLKVNLEEADPERPWSDKAVPVIRPEAPPFPEPTPGMVCRKAGRLAYQSVLKAHKLISSGLADLLVTCPINKEAIHKAGYAVVAHTEILGRLCGVENPITLFVAKKLWIAFFTRHLPLKEAVGAVRTPALVRFIKELFPLLKKVRPMGKELAIAALNPHGGEGGLLGMEEEKEIKPAVEACRKAGIPVKGPVPADAVFHLAGEGRFSCVISLYHDQGHIAAKTASFHKTVSLTLGLPYIRTSVDHGTGFDIAWKGLAREDSLTEAVLLASSLAARGVG